MRPRAIPLVFREPVPGIPFVQSHHHTIPRHFRDNARRRNRKAPLIAFHYSYLRQGRSMHPKPIHQKHMGRRIQLFRSLHHRPVVRALYPMAINEFVIDHTYSNAIRPSHNPVKQRFPLRFGQLLRVVQFWNTFPQYHRPSNDRTR